MAAKVTDANKPAEAQGTGQGGGGHSNAGNANSGSANSGNSNASNAGGKRDEDVALVCGVSDDGQGLDILRKRQGRIEAGTVRPLEEGKPIHGEVVRLKPRQQSPLVCDVEVDLPATSTRSASTGPAQVATDQYRKNWDAIYKGRAKKPLLN